MFKKAFLLLLILISGGLRSAAQESSPMRYIHSRERLAEDTFKRLVEISSTYDQLNLAADLSASLLVAEQCPELRAAVFENCIFAYCRVHDSLRTAENHRVVQIEGRRSYTAKTTDPWLALGREYTEKRLQLEKARVESLLAIPSAAGLLAARIVLCQPGTPSDLIS